MVMFGPYVLAVHESIPVKTAAELIAYAKANPGKLAVANSGVGGANHITALVMQKELGIQFKHVPYKGGAAATRAVVAGERRPHQWRVGNPSLREQQATDWPRGHRRAPRPLRSRSANVQGSQAAVAANSAPGRASSWPAVRRRR